jgi:geranylgeranyl reductase
MTKRLTSTCDVAVVGAGPAGIAAAAALASAGARVALLDKRLRPGVKACGGGLTAAAWERAGIDAEAPPAYGRALAAIELCSPFGRRRLEADEPLIVVVDRAAWQGERLAGLAQMGVDVRLGERALGLADDGLVTSRGRIACAHVIAADGASSRLRRLAGLEPGPGIRALQVEVDAARARGIDPDVASVWFDPSGLGLGYAWAFPTAAGTIRLGAGADAATVSAARLRRGFLAWLAKIGVAVEPGEIRSGAIRCGYSGHRFGRLRLAGDAAGLASPVTGEGIAQALASGAEVAREILEPAYRSPILEALAARHRRTHGILAAPFLGAALFALAPPLLRIRALREAALRRYA